MNAMQMVMEAYAGRCKEMIQCEGYIKEIIKVIKEDNKTSKVTRKRRVSRDFEPCRKLERTLEKFLKVGEICIYWDSGSINAFTITPLTVVTAKRSKSGNFEKAKFHVIIYENLVTNANLNERELMAMLLHELGHCFYYSPFILLGELTSVVLCPPMFLVEFLMVELIKLNNASMDVLKQKCPFLYNLYSAFGNVMVQINSIKNLMPMAINPTTLVTNLINKVTNPFSTIGGYGNERGADSFAAKYGYGPDLMVALKKAYNPENTIGGAVTHNTGTFGEVMADLSAIQMDLFAAVTLNEHPNNDIRANSIIRKLERDLATGDYPPELKKDLEQEIARSKKVYKTIYDNKGNVEIRKAWYKSINLFTDGHGDIRELLDAVYAKYEY